MNIDMTDAPQHHKVIDAMTMARCMDGQGLPFSPDLCEKVWQHYSNTQDMIWCKLPPEKELVEILRNYAISYIATRHWTFSKEEKQDGNT